MTITKSSAEQAAKNRKQIMADDQAAKNRKQYTEVSYSGRKLLEQYPLDTEGVWQVYGEDPNCDWGGSHHEPELGIFSGKLTDIIDIAVNMPRFWQWGGGGRIKLVSVVQVDANSQAKIHALKEEKKFIVQRLAELNSALGE